MVFEIPWSIRQRHASRITVCGKIPLFIENERLICLKRSRIGPSAQSNQTEKTERWLKLTYNSPLNSIPFLKRHLFSGHQILTVISLGCQVNSLYVHLSDSYPVHCHFNSTTRLRTSIARVFLKASIFMSLFPLPTF